MSRTASVVTRIEIYASAFFLTAGMLLLMSFPQASADMAPGTAPDNPTEASAPALPEEECGDYDNDQVCDIEPME